MANNLQIYKVEPIMKNLPLQIECLFSYDDYFLIGTKQGHLLMYKLDTKRTSSSSDPKFELHLLRSNKQFAKKPIVQVEAVPDLRILISLSDNVVSVHNLDQITFPTITCMSKTKGATLFVLDVMKIRTQTGETITTLRMCVVVRNKLMIFYWKNNDFHEFVSDLKFPDTPRMIAWCGEALCVGFKSDYSLIKISGEPKELFPTGGKQPEPMVVLLDGNRFALGRDENTYILDNEGSPFLNYPISWSDIPINLVDDSPSYLLAILPNSIVEVRTIEPKLFIQKIDLSSQANSKIKHIVKCLNKKERILVASSNDIFCLVRVNDHQKILVEIQNIHAFDLFCKKQYKEALQLFLKLNTDPSFVIGLFPDLLPDDYRNRIDYPSKPPTLTGADLETGLFALKDFLLEIRRTFAGNNCVENSSSSEDNTDNISPHKPKYLLRHIIDTTLLKCYLIINDALVSSLLRLPDNYCHLEETEKALKKHHKYNELIILYQNKQLHKRALDLLYKQSKKIDSPLAGHERTIQYLQDLGHENLDLIFEYASWVLKEYPEEGIKIFTEETASEMENLPRQVVIDYLQKVNSDLIIPYLEHVIFVWNDLTASFHNALVLKYREKIRILLNEYKKSVSDESDECLPAGQEPGELGVMRTKLLHFLDVSDHYSTDLLPTYLLNDGLFEERAVVMGKIGNHKDAIGIYVHILNDLTRAEEYCDRMYKKGNSENKDVFLILLAHLLSPLPPPNHPSSHSKDATIKLEPNIQAAVRLLSIHATKIDALKAIGMLPDSIALADLKEFLQSMSNHMLVEKHGSQIFRNLLLAQRLQVHDQRIRLQQLNKVVVDENDSCRVCLKKIGKSVFVRFPNKDLVHFMCKERYHQYR